MYIIIAFHCSASNQCIWLFFHETSLLPLPTPQLSPFRWLGMCASTFTIVTITRTAIITCTHWTWRQEDCRMVAIQHPQEALILCSWFWRNSYHWLRSSTCMILYLQIFCSSIKDKIVSYHPRFVAYPLTLRSLLKYTIPTCHVHLFMVFSLSLSLSLSLWRASSIVRNCLWFC